MNCVRISSPLITVRRTIVAAVGSERHHRQKVEVESTGLALEVEVDHHLAVFDGLLQDVALARSVRTHKYARPWPAPIVSHSLVVRVRVACVRCVRCGAYRQADG